MKGGQRDRKQIEGDSLSLSQICNKAMDVPEDPKTVWLRASCHLGPIATQLIRSNLTAQKWKELNSTTTSTTILKLLLVSTCHPYWLLSSFSSSFVQSISIFPQSTVPHYILQDLKSNRGWFADIIFVRCS